MQVGLLCAKRSQVCLMGSSFACIKRADKIERHLNLCEHYFKIPLTLSHTTLMDHSMYTG